MTEHRLSRPGQREIEADLLYDYRTNVASYPAWQAWLRAHAPPTLVVWGRNDPSFIAPGAEAFKRDLPDSEIHLLDAGHFANTWLIDPFGPHPGLTRDCRILVERQLANVKSLDPKRRLEKRTFRSLTIICKTAQGVWPDGGTPNRSLVSHHKNTFCCVSRNCADQQSGSWRGHRRQTPRGLRCGPAAILRCRATWWGPPRSMSILPF
jgi:hypothetical protein